MKRYWFKFAGKHYSELPFGIIMGCGVTAINYEDAINIIREKVFQGGELPQIITLIEDIDISLLEENHVRLNIGNIFPRGIWFPLGYN